MKHIKSHVYNLVDLESKEMYAWADLAAAVAERNIKLVTKFSIYLTWIQKKKNELKIDF